MLHTPPRFVLNGYGLENAFVGWRLAYIPAHPSDLARPPRKLEQEPGNLPAQSKGSWLPLPQPLARFAEKEGALCVMLVSYKYSHLASFQLQRIIMQQIKPHMFLGDCGVQLESKEHKDSWPSLMYKDAAIGFLTVRAAS